MARIAGVNLPAQKHVWVGLQSIYGIGRTRSQKVCEAAGVPSTTKIRDLSEPQVEALRAEVGNYVVEGDLRREVGVAIKRLMDLACYRGLRHRRGLPLRQRSAADQCPDPQGPAQAAIKSKGTQTMAKPAAANKTKKKIKRVITDGIAHVHASFNNTIITITDRQGNALSWATSAARASAVRASRPVRRAGRRREGRQGRARLRREVAGSAHQGPGPGRESAVRSLNNAGYKITNIIDVTPIPHNGAVRRRSVASEEQENMARYLGPTCKNRAPRRRRPFPQEPGARWTQVQAGAEARPARRHPRRTKLSDYATQLREKQKVKRIYGLLERQFRNYYKGVEPEGQHRREPPADAGDPPRQRRLPHGLRGHPPGRAPAGFAPRRDRERQAGEPAVVRGQGRRRDRPVGKGAEAARVQESLAVAKQMDLSPAWIEVDANKFAGVFKAVPDRADLPSDINEALIVELYSK